jgi:hypothetical protein
MDHCSREFPCTPQTQEVRYRAALTNRNYFSTRTNRDEFEANRLTACLIAPFHKAGFTLGMAVDEVINKFGLSRDAAEKRLEEFERVFRRKHGISRQLGTNVIDYLTEQKQKGHNVVSLDNIASLLPDRDKCYEGDPCPCCKAMMLLRKGLARECDNCGARLGDD